MDYEVLIVGGGIAGAYTALCLNEDIKVLLITKDNLKNCNTDLAQGGISCVMDKDDSFELHIEDTLKAGRRTNNLDMLKIMVEEGPKNLENLIKWGVPFDRTSVGELDLTLEGGHSKRRIAHVKDKTGEAVLDKLIEKLRQKGNIDILENTLFTGGNKESDGFVANLIREDKKASIRVKNIVLATGGIGRIYKNTTNSSIATGEAMIFAKEFGVGLKKLSSIQFHPTAFYEMGDSRFLISESLRGEGAILKNSYEESFMESYDDRGSLAPRDVVSSSMVMEMKKYKEEHLYLDIRGQCEEFLSKRFPKIYTECLKRGINISKDLIPVSPCQHYFMGGIEVDENSKTKVDGIYGVGECSHTGVHGENRLASNSLLEGLVFGNRAAKHINKNNRVFSRREIVWEDKSHKGQKSIGQDYKNAIRKIMDESYLVVFDRSRAKDGIKSLECLNMKLEASNFELDRDYYETRGMISLGLNILKEKMDYV